MDKNMKDDITKYGSIPDPFVKSKVKYTATQLLTLITLALSSFCAGACMGLQAPFFPAEAEKKGASPTVYSFIMGIFQLTIFLTAPIMGKLVPYVSPKLLINVGSFTIGVTIILFGTLDMVLNHTQFIAMAFVLRILEGIGTAALKTSCYTIIASQFSEELGTTFAILETSVGVGLITGPTLGGAFYDLGGYGLPFYVVGSIVVIDSVVIYFVLPDVENVKIPEKSNLLKFWLNPQTLIYSLCVFTVFNYVGFNQATLEYHIREFKLSGFLLGMMFAFAGIMYASAAPGWGWLCDRKCDCQTLCLIGSLIIVCSLLLMGPAPFLYLKPSLGLIIAALALMGFANGAKLVGAFTGTLKNAMVGGLRAELSTYGLVSSIFASSQSLGAFAGTSIGGYLLDQFGYPNASMALLILECILITLLIITTVKKKFSSTTLNNLKAEKDSSSKEHLVCEEGIKHNFAMCNSN